MRRCQWQHSLKDYDVKKILMNSSCICSLIVVCRSAPDGGEKLSWKYEQSMKTRLEGD